MSLDFASSPNMTMSVIFHLLLCLLCVCFLGASFLSPWGWKCFSSLLSLFCVCEVAMAWPIETANGVQAWRRAHFYSQPETNIPPLECQIFCKHCNSSLVQPNLHFGRDCRCTVTSSCFSRCNARACTVPKNIFTPWLQASARRRFSVVSMCVVSG